MPCAGSLGWHSHDPDHGLPAVYGRVGSDSATTRGSRPR
ncbi:hypothetical protein SALBM217S_04953 [Streptomyces griseoloalbus]